jgi:LPXTG-site transpeptidase (sortase) family protein
MPLYLKLVPAYVVVAWMIAVDLVNLNYKGTEVISPEVQVQNVKVATVVDHTFGKPVWVSIPRLSLGVNVEAGSSDRDGRKWTLSWTKAYYATVSAIPNDLAGNTVIYGHNVKEVFGRTEDLKIGDRLFIRTDKGLLVTYRFFSSFDVDPSDTSIFDYQGKPIVTLITCSGILDQKRRLMQFELAEGTNES